MISRVAEHCFWLLRYVERAESMASLLRVNRSFLLDINVPESQRWRPLLIVCGEEDRFPELRSAEAVNDGEQVQEYLTWDEKCSVGIAASVYWARENARTIRDVISLEMWESINTFWRWLKDGKGQKLYEKDRDAYYRHVRESVSLFQGICHNTMLHEEPFYFLRLGMLLERGNQTARAMDVKYHLVGPTRVDEGESPLEIAQWMALLRTCSARDLYFRRYHQGIRKKDVVDFLFKQEGFPRSIYHCLTRAWNFLQRIEEATGGRGEESVPMLKALVESVAAQSTVDILEKGLHRELTRVIDTTADVCVAIHRDFFDPSFVEPVGAIYGE